MDKYPYDSTDKAYQNELSARLAVYNALYSRYEEILQTQSDTTKNIIALDSLISFFLPCFSDNILSNDLILERYTL